MTKIALSGSVSRKGIGTTIFAIFRGGEKRFEARASTSKIFYRVDAARKPMPGQTARARRGPEMRAAAVAISRYARMKNRQISAWRARSGA